MIERVKAHVQRVLQRIEEIEAKRPFSSLPPSLPAPSVSRTDFDEIIARQAKANGLETALLRAVIQAESNFDPRAMSPQGAMGLMQLMPATAAALGVSDPFDPEQNIAGGARYLRQQLDRFGDLSLALAAYNAGPGNVARYHGLPPFPETQAYVSRVLATLSRTPSL